VEKFTREKDIIVEKCTRREGDNMVEKFNCTRSKGDSMVEK
jgi:hypothetical protein